MILHNSNLPMYPFLYGVLSEKSLATSDRFPIYLVNAASMESCSICSETGFISEQLCVKTFVAVAGAEEKRGWIYGKGTLSNIGAILVDSVSGPRYAKA